MEKITRVRALTPKSPKIKRQVKCKVCRNLFVKMSITHKTCSPECAIELMQQEKAKKVARADRIKRVELRPKREWLRLTQAAVNAYVRKRDGNTCISCGRKHKGQMHAGHYLSVGARPELRFELENINAQCSACNNYLSGNITLYRINLIKKIGLERVEWLESYHPPKLYTIEDLQEIRRVFTAKLKELG